jgi:uncharacterized protein
MLAESVDIKQFLGSSKRIAIVGASSKPDRTSHEISEFLMKKGHKIIPIHPKEQEVLGEKVLPSLESLGEAVDGVIIYLNQSIVGDQVKVAINKKIPLIWLPLEINMPEELKSQILEYNLKYVENKCPKIEWPKFF